MIFKSLKVKIIILLLWLQVAFAQKAQDLLGLTGEIQKIEQFDYMDAQLINGKWHIGKNDHPRKTEKIFDRSGLLQIIQYVQDNVEINRVYYYDKGKMARVERLDSVGNLQGISGVDWLTEYTAVAAKLDKDGKCLHKLYWYYNSNFSLSTFIITNSCSDKSPNVDVATKAIYHYDAKGFNYKREIAVQGHNYVIYYDVLEKDTQGNPSVIVERHIDEASKNEIQTLTLYRYTYFDEKPKTERFKNVVLAKNADNIFARTNEDAGQLKPEEPKEISNNYDVIDESGTVAPVNYETCINHNKYTLKQRLKFYPFNQAKEVALISYKDDAVEAELYAFKNKLPDLVQADKVVILNSQEVNDLTNTIYNIGYAEPVFVKTLAIDCSTEKNAIVFLDERGKPFEYILLYFGCNHYGYSSEKVKDGDYCTEKFDLLKQHFIAKGIPTAP